MDEEKPLSEQGKEETISSADDLSPENSPSSANTMKGEFNPDKKPADLSHFSRMAQKSMEIEEKETWFDKLSYFFSSFSRREKEEKDNTDDDGPVVQMLDKTGNLIGQHPKKIISAVAVALLLIFLITVLLPLIPLQIQRSAGFSAMGAKDYQAAFAELSTYLTERPNDHEAAYQAALAALYSENLPYAEKAFGKLYRGKLLAEPELAYNFALVKINQPQHAVAALNRFLAQEGERTQHVAGLLLRGILLSQDAATSRRGREDIVLVDELVRTTSLSQADQEKIFFLHKFLSKSGVINLSVDAILSGEAATKIESASAALLGFDIGWNGYINRYHTSDAEIFLNDNLSVHSIVLLYLAHTWISGGDFDEAENEIKRALDKNPNSPTIKQLYAILKARQGDNEAAGKLFAELAAGSGDVQTQVNWAVARWAAVPEKSNIPAIMEIYDDILSQQPNNEIAANNSAFFFLIDGDSGKASELLSALPTEIKKEREAAIKFNRSLVALWEGNVLQAIDLMRSISSKDIPQVGVYAAALQLETGDFDGAFFNLWEVRQKSPQDTAALLAYAETIVNLGIWRIAYNALTDFLSANTDNTNAGVRFYLALVALRLGESEEFSKQKAFLQNVAADDKHYYYALQGAEKSREHKLQSEAAADYWRAMAEAPTLKQQQRYAVQWAQLVVEDRSADVVDELTSLIEKRFSPELAAILTYALALSEPSSVAELVRRLGDNFSNFYVVQKYLGAALVELGEEESGFVLLEKARQRTPTDMRYLSFLEKAQRTAEKTTAADQTKQVIADLQAIAGGKGPIDNISFKIALPVIVGLAKKIQSAVSNDTSENRRAVLSEYESIISRTKNIESKAQLARSRGTFYFFLEMYAEAAADFEQAIALGLSNPEDQVTALLFYAKALKLRGNFDEALSTVEQVMQIKGQHPAYLRLQSDILLDLGDSVSARKTLEALLHRYPSDIKAYYDIAVLDFQKDNITGAIQWLEQLLRVLPDVSFAYKRLAEHYLTVGERWRAEIYLDAYSRLSSNTQ